MFIKRNFFALIFVLFLPTAVHAQGAAGAARAGMASQGGIELTGYSAACAAYDGQHGGPNESPSGLKPRDFTVDGQSQVVMTAVPQQGGTADLFKKCFKIHHPDMQQYANKVFFAGDRYGTGSNGQRKIDVSHECTPAVQNFKKQEAAVEEVACPPEISARQPAGS